MYPKITPLKNRNNIGKYELDRMAQEGLDWGIMIKIILST